MLRWFPTRVKLKELDFLQTYRGNRQFSVAITKALFLEQTTKKKEMVYNSESKL